MNQISAAYDISAMEAQGVYYAPRAIRYNLEELISVFDQFMGKKIGTLINFSETGLGFIARKPLKVDDTLLVRLKVKKDGDGSKMEFLDLKITIKHVREKRLGNMYHMGAQHEALNAKTKIRMARFLAKLKNQIS